MELKQIFLPGDIVILRQEIDNRPKMVVVKKVKHNVRISGDKNICVFQGILCRWYTTSNDLKEAVFNTKDLIKL